MTIPSGPVSTSPAPGDGVNALWPFGFSVSSSAEVEVVRTASGGGDTTISPDDYAVALTDGGDGGGVVTYPKGATRVPVGDFITVRLSPSFDQPTDLKNQGDYSPEDVEAALDHQERQILRLRDDQGRMLRAGAGITINLPIGAPVDGRPLSWRLRDNGSWDIIAGQLEEQTAARFRVLYADDLGLKGDGTDETATLNAKLLEYQDDPTIIHLQAPAGYWPINDQLLNRSSIQLSFGSPVRLGASGSLNMYGTLSLRSGGAVLSADAAASDTVLAAAAVAGALSASFAVGDQVAVGGSGSTNVYRVTAINDAGSVTVTPGLRAAVASGATIKRLRFAYCTQSWTRHETPREIPVDSITDFALGCTVWVTSDETLTHLDGIQTDTISHELARVVDFGAGTLILDRPIKHWMSTSDRARVVRLEPCRNASISGAAVQFTEAPSATRVDTFVMSFADRCSFMGCQIPNDDDFGSRGHGFRFHLSLDCTGEGLAFGPAKYYGAGESYAVSFVKSTACKVFNVAATGPRHVVSFQGSTDCVAMGVAGRSWHVNCIDFHSHREIGCWALDVDGVGSDEAGASGVCWGNPSWPGGVYECGVTAVEITDLEGTGAAAVRINSPTDSCVVEDAIFRRTSIGIYAQNYQGSVNLETGRVEITADFHRCAVAGNVDMNKYGGTQRPFNRLDISRARFFDWVDGLKIDNVDDVVATDMVMQTTRAGAGTYAVALDNCGAARIGGLFDGCQKHLTSKDTPVDLARFEIRNPNTTALWDETSAAPVSGCREIAGIFPPGWTPARSSPQTTINLYSLPGMS